MDINLLNYKESSLNYKLFKEFYSDFKKKYKDYIFKKNDDINEEKFKSDTKILLINIKKIIDLYHYIDFLDEEFSEESEDNFNNDIYSENKKIVKYITEISSFLSEFDRQETCKYLKKLFISVESYILTSNKNRDEIQNLELTVFKLKTLIYIKNTTKYLDMVKKNFEIYQNNYEMFEKQGNFLGIVNEIRLLGTNYKCIYEKYIDLNEYFLYPIFMKHIFTDMDPLIQKLKQTFVLLLEEHTVFLKKYC